MDYQKLARELRPFIYLPQSARVYNNAAITLTTSTLTSLTFNSERWDDNTFHSTSADTGRLTVTQPGRYLVGASVWFAANATGQRELYITVNGATRIAEETRTNTGGSLGVRVSMTAWYEVSAADYFTVVAWQNSGGNLDIEVFGNASPEFWIVGPL